MTKIFTLVIDYLSAPLSTLFNNYSLYIGIFLSLPKHASVVPVYISGSELDVNNCRPICMLHHLGKLFEKCVSSRMNQFLDQFNLINVNQKMKPADAIRSVVENVYCALNNKNNTLGI